MDGSVVFIIALLIHPPHPFTKARLTHVLRTTTINKARQVYYDHFFCLLSVLCPNISIHFSVLVCNDKLDSSMLTKLANDQTDLDDQNQNTSQWQYFNLSPPLLLFCHSILPASSKKISPRTISDKPLSKVTIPDTVLS